MNKQQEYLNMPAEERAREAERQIQSLWNRTLEYGVDWQQPYQQELDESKLKFAEERDRTLADLGTLLREGTINADYYSAVKKKIEAAMPFVFTPQERANRISGVIIQGLEHNLSIELMRTREPYLHIIVEGERVKFGWTECPDQQPESPKDLTSLVTSATVQFGNLSPESTVQFTKAYIDSLFAGEIFRGGRYTPVEQKDTHLILKWTLLKR